MVELEIHNRLIRIKNASRKTLRAIDQATSYLVEGYFFADAYKQGYWDGRERLLKKSGDEYWTYSGLLQDVINALGARGDKPTFTDKTRRGKRRRLRWNSDVVLRPYQKRVVKQLMDGPIPGVGTAVMPIRSGKTKTSAWFVKRIGRRALVIVPSKLLLHQTAEAFRECFPDETIGVVGDSVYSPEFITIATVQTLSKLRESKDPRWDELRAVDTLVLDEAHHARGGGEWRKVFVDVDARYRLGLSATLYEDLNTEQARGIIWARAACGPVRARVTTTELVRKGFLMRQNVTMYNVNDPKLYRNASWSQTVVKRCIHENPVRNSMIAEMCERFAAERRRVIVCVGRLNHIAALEEALEARGVDFRILTGKDSTERRDEVIEGLVGREYHVVVGTILREGIDIPTVDVVVNAEGGADLKNSVQRQRNLTVSEGKTEANFIDFMDLTNKRLKAHSRARFRAYDSEPTATVEVRDWS